MEFSRMWLAPVGVIIVWIVLSVEAGEKRCKFPRSWKGRWYQNSLGVFEIRSRSMDGKGQCEKKYGNYFLLKNKEADCIQCLLMFERHKNILQYRESFCFPKSTSPKAICDDIRVETDMYTLVREKATPVMCPITEAYYFTYDDQQSGTCDKPLSYAQPCVGNEKYQFNFRHCNSQATMHDSNFDLQCLAVWKEGSETHMYGQLSGARTPEDSYRCFKYEKYGGSDVYMTMSLDSTCRGLFSARNGVFMMHFVKDLYGWPEPTCLFPTWLRGLPWKDVEGNNVFQLNGENFSLFVFSYGPVMEMKSEFRCIDKIKQKGDTYVLLTFATIRCVSVYKCVKIKLLGKLAMSLQIGDVSMKKNGDQCPSGTDYTQSYLILPNTDNVISCPHPAIYPSKSSCSDSLNIGCYNSTSVIYKTTCTGSQGFNIDCKAFWEDGDTTYVIGHTAASSGLQCYSFQRTGTSLEWRSDPTCDHITSRHHKYKDVKHFSIQTDQCFLPKDKSTSENEVIKWSETLPKPRQKTPASSHDHKDSSSDKKHNSKTADGKHTYYNPAHTDNLWPHDLDRIEGDYPMFTGDNNNYEISVPNSDTQRRRGLSPDSNRDMNTLEHYDSSASQVYKLPCLYILFIVCLLLTANNL